MYFNDRLWLIDIYFDNSEQIVIQKSSQISITEMMLCELFAQAYQGRAVLYVLPTDILVYGFTPRRIDNLIGRVKLYRDSCGNTRKASDSKKQKTLFGVDCNIVGANSDLNFYEKPCDVLIIDEHDKCDQDNLKIAWDRLESAKQNIVRIIGNPTFTGVGINERFEDSDHKEWLIRCDACGEWQPFDWFKNVVRKIDDKHYELRDNSFRGLEENSDGDASVLCRRCDKPIDRLKDGRWVAKHPGREISGYHASSIFGNPRPGTILRLYQQFTAGLTNPTAMQLFYNNRLGLPYDAEGTKIDAALLRACADAEYSMPLKHDGPCVAGVDIGNQLHVTITENHKGKERYVFIGCLASYDELRQVVDRFNVRMGVMDAGPEIHEPRKFVRETPGAWYLCRYNLNDKLRQGAKCNYGNMFVDHKSRSISVNRTESLDESMENYVSQSAILPGNYATLDGGEFVKQMMMPTRVKEERPDGTFRYIWTKGVDHYRHSDNYRNVGVKMLRGQGGLVG